MFAVLVLVGKAHLDKVLFRPVVSQVEVAHPFLFVQFAEVAHGFLAVQLEELQVAVIVLGEHHLAAVGLFATCFSIGACPVQFPLAAQFMVSVQLMVLEGIDVGDVVASPQIMPFGVHAFAALIGVAGIAGIEEGIADAVVLAQGVAHGGQGGHFQGRGVFVIGEVVLYVARGFECLVEGVVHALRLVAEAERTQYTQGLFAHGEVASEAQVTAEFGQGCTSVHIESGMEDVVLCYIFVEVEQRHVVYLFVERGRLEERTVAVHLIEVASQGIEPSSNVEAGGQEFVCYVLLGADVDVRAAIVGKGAGIIDFADGDVLHRTRGEEIERDELVVGVGRGDGKSVQRGGAVAVAQSTDNELS